MIGAGAQIRPAQPQDLHFIIEMARLSCTLEGRASPAPDDPDVIAVLPSQTDAAFVATDDEGGAIGAAWWHFHDPLLICDVNGTPLPELVIGVLDEARGQGIGTRLVNALVDEAARREFSALTLNVHLRNPAARLYMRAGFRVAAAGRGWFGVAMSRRLHGDSDAGAD